MPGRSQLALSLSFAVNLLFFVCIGNPCPAQTSGATSADNTLTAEVLRDTLYAKTGEEIEYCKFVIRMRDQKILPNKVLYYAYKKAMMQEKGRRFVYFQKILEMVCDNQGIILEDTKMTKAKKFFGFDSASDQSSQTNPVSFTLAKPISQNTSNKPFAFIQRLFTK